MQDKDLFFSTEDLGEIFGGQIAGPEKSTQVKEEKQKITAPAEKKEAQKEAPVSKLITHTKTDEFRIIEQLSAADRAKEKPQAARATAEPSPEADVDDLIKRAREIEEKIKKETPDSAAKTKPGMASVEAATAASVVSVSPGMAPGTLGEKTASDLVGLNEELSRFIHTDLAVKLPEKTVLNMMSKTLEKAALNFLILRNTNWDRSGNLKNDGTVDMERFLINISKYREQIPEMEREVAMALSGLLFMRLRSIKLGLGARAYEEMKEKIEKKANIIGAGYGSEAAKIMKETILPDAFSKGDEEK